MAIPNQIRGFSLALVPSIKAKCNVNTCSRHRNKALVNIALWFVNMIVRTVNTTQAKGKLNQYLGDFNFHSSEIDQSFISINNYNININEVLVDINELVVESDQSFDNISLSSINISKREVGLPSPSVKSHLLQYNTLRII
jgi:hypothetical protein